MDLKATGGNNNRHTIDNEQGTLEKLEVEMKNTIFGVLFVLLKEREVSIYIWVVISVIQFLQIIVFPFHPTIASVWLADDISDVLYQIFGYFDIVTYMKDTNYSLYITFFYIGLAVVALVYAMSFYVSFLFNRKKAVFSWPVVILKNVLLLFTTIFFLPFFEYFITIPACVENTAGTTVHTFFSEVECWKNGHIIHGVFAIISAIFFIVVSLTASLTFFEYKNTNNDPTARVSSRPNFLVNVYQMIMIICLTFLTGDQFQVILLALILIGSVVIFVKFYFNSPYHDEIIAKLWACIAAINLWTAVMVVFSRIMENTLFEGSIIAWLLGIPFVVLIILTNRDNRIDLLLINVNKFQNGEEIQSQIRYILKLIDWQATNKNAAILLDGYLEIHKQSCNMDDCPLRQKSIKNNRFTKSLMNQDESLNEKYAILIQLLYKMYDQGIKKFPNANALRISYSFFLLEKMHSKQQALQELTQAEQNRPSVDEQFVIFRYKKLIEDEIAESQNEGQGGLDVVSEVSFQNNLRNLQANIEKSALLHMEFWSQLSEDNPDLAKLSDIGSKINSSVQYVEDNWFKLLKVNANNAKSMRLYGKYLIEIINDKETGDSLLEKARTITNVQSNKKAMNFGMVSMEETSNEATPTIWVSGEQDKSGIITGINLAAASLFGYNKTELLNRKVNVLMPQVFSKYHDSFMENYLNTGESVMVGKNKEKMVFGKNKSNYIFPVYLSIKAATSIIQGIQFIATFRVEKNFKSAAYVLTNPDGTIDGVSSSCINILKFDLKAITVKRANIQDYIPNLIRERGMLFSSANSAGKATANFRYNYPKDSEYVTENEDSSVQLVCSLYELSYLSGRENGGFHLKFERTIEKPSGNNPADRRAKISNFQFRYERNKAAIMGEYVDGSTNDLNSGTSGEDNDNMLDPLNKSANENDPSGIEGSGRNPALSRASQQDEEEQEIKRVNYGIGIKTLRLMDGRAQEIEEAEPEEGDEDAEGNNENSGTHGQKNGNGQYGQSQEAAQDEENQEEGSYKDFSTTFKSRKALNSVINDRTPPVIIKKLKYVAVSLSVVLLAIAIIDYVVASKEFNAIQKKIDLLDKSNEMVAELMNACSKMRDLNMLRIGISASTLTEDRSRESLKNSLDAAKKLKEYLEKQTEDLSEGHLNLLNNPSINLVSIDTKWNKKGLTQAIEEIISRGFTVLSKDLAHIYDEDDDYYYVMNNMLNELYMGLEDSSNYYSIELNDKVSSKNTSFLLLLLGSIFALLLTILIAFPIFYQVNRSRLEILSLFLDIPEKTVKGLYNKCETFISNLQVGEEDEMISEIDDEELEKNQDDNNGQDFITRKKRKKFKNSAKGQKSFLIKFAIMAVFIEAYFFYNFFSSTSLLDDISTLTVEFNSTSKAESFYGFANNVERQLFLTNNSAKVLTLDNLDVAVSNIKQMYDLDSLILQLHSINRKIHTDVYTDEFNQIMMVNPCVSLGDSVNQTDCKTFGDLTVYQGMTVALTRHFENLRTLLSCYTNLVAGLNCTIDLPAVNGVTPTSFRAKVYSLLATTQSIETSKMQNLYIKSTMRLLMTAYRECLSDKFDSALTIRLIIFIIFILFLNFVNLLLWIPLIQKISNDIWRTKSMLSMIPLNVIAKIRSIRIYLKRFWNERNLAEY